jgi:hypothetical protein
VHGRGLRARCSLARTAAFLLEHAATAADAPPLELNEVPVDKHVEETPWGQTNRVAAPVSIEGTPFFWERPAGKLGTANAEWNGD